ncbi:MAG: class II aldolase/adducin family protein [Prolixibacteraceae bacterium]
MHEPGEGYIKFDCHLTKEKIDIQSELFEPLNHWRSAVWDKGMIGVYPDGIGYGNISIRVPGTDSFYISGTATGSIPVLDPAYYSLVERCNPTLNAIWCRGMIRASAESMSHAAIYAANSDVGAVVHIHNRQLWEKYLDELPTTDPNVAYGTPDMAFEIDRIMTLPATLLKKIFVMGGHEEGLVSFGKTVEEAALIILALE